MSFDLHESAKKHTLIVCHRGATGGNIPCNTLPAFEIALMQGADMLEADVSKTLDGTLCIFHPRMESRHLNKECSIPEMTWEQVRELRYVNMNRTPTQFGIVTLDDLLEQFKNRCFINLDKFWDAPADIYRAVKRHDMLDQVLVKSPPTDEVVTVLKEIGPDVPYMPVIYEGREFPPEALMESGINYYGLFKLNKQHFIK